MPIGWITSGKTANTYSFTASENNGQNARTAYAVFTQNDTHEKISIPIYQQAAGSSEPNRLKVDIVETATGNGKFPSHNILLNIETNVATYERTAEMAANDIPLKQHPDGWNSGEYTAEVIGDTFSKVSMKFQSTTSFGPMTTHGTPFDVDSITIGLYDGESIVRTISYSDDIPCDTFATEGFVVYNGGQSNQFDKIVINIAYKPKNTTNDIGLYYTKKTVGVGMRGFSETTVGHTDHTIVNVTLHFSDSTYTLPYTANNWTCIVPPTEKAQQQTQDGNQNGSGPNSNNNNNTATASSTFYCEGMTIPSATLEENGLDEYSYVSAITVSFEMSTTEPAGTEITAWVTLQFKYDGDKWVDAIDEITLGNYSHKFEFASLQLLPDIKNIWFTAEYQKRNPEPSRNAPFSVEIVDENTTVYGFTSHYSSDDAVELVDTIRTATSLNDLLAGKFNQADKHALVEASIKDAQEMISPEIQTGMTTMEG